MNTLSKYSVCAGNIWYSFIDCSIITLLRIKGIFYGKNRQISFKKGIKYILNFVFPIIIGELFSAFINCMGTNNFKKTCIILFSLIIIIVLYGFCVCRYFKIEKNIDEKLEKSERENKILKAQNNVYQKNSVLLTSLFNSAASEVNKIANELKQKPKLEKWNYKVSSKLICNAVYETLCSLTGKDDFSVNIVVYDFKAKGKSKNIKMIAEKSKFETPSDTFEKTMYMSSNKDFYAVKMFNKNSNSLAILTTNEEIKEKFVFSEDKNEHPYYTQYVGIPIHCDSNKMVSLLQISSLNDTHIGTTKEDIINNINNFILPFTYLSLLNNKIEKLAINSISELNKLEEDN